MEGYGNISRICSFLRGNSGSSGKKIGSSQLLTYLLKSCVRLTQNSLASSVSQTSDILPTFKHHFKNKNIEIPQSKWSKNKKLLKDKKGSMKNIRGVGKQTQFLDQTAIPSFDENRQFPNLNP